jgi:Transposase domain (DUF772)/Transposase DDE domain
MSQPRDDRQDGLFHPSLETIINLRHPLVRLAGEMNWDFVGRRLGSVCRVGPGQPPLSTRLVAGLFILKHMHNLSDEELCARWVENPYYQYFCGEVVFRHELATGHANRSRRLIKCAKDSRHHRQFVLHAKALHGNPHDGHTLGPVIANLEKLTGVTVCRIHGDKGYRGHNYPDRFKVWISGQVRRVTKSIRREMRRRSAVEPVIGHLKDDHRMRRNHLKGRAGDRTNAVLAAAGYNFSLLLRWFQEFLRALLLVLSRVPLGHRFA